MQRILFISGFLALGGSGALRAQQVHLYGNDHFDVTTSYEGVSMYEFSSATVLPGGDLNWLQSNQNSAASIAGGSVDWVYAWGSSSIAFSSGVVDLIAADNASSVEISGGSLNRLSATGISNTVLHGFDFQLGSGLSWAPNGQEILGTGLLTGKWLGQTEAWTIRIIWNEPSAPITAIPEPSSLFLMLGGLLVRRSRFLKAV